MPRHVLFVFSSIPQSIPTQWTRALEPFLRSRFPIRGTLSVSFISEREMRRLNVLYRGKDVSTDVLSFRLHGDEKDGTDPGDSSEAVCGEALFCLPVLKRHAREHGRTVAQEFRVMLIHAVGHILGFDHADDRSAKSMEAFERKAFAHLKNLGKGKKIQYTKSIL